MSHSNPLAGTFAEMQNNTPRISDEKFKALCEKHAADPELSEVFDIVHFWKIGEVRYKQELEFGKTKIRNLTASLSDIESLAKRANQ